MKKNYMMMICAAIILVGVGYKMMIQADFWNDVKGTASSVGKEFEKGYETVKKEVTTAATTAVECANVGVKYTELAAKEVAYASAKKAMDAALALQSNDPRIVALQGEIASYQVAQRGIDVGAAAGTWGVETISTLGQTVGKILTSGFNPKKFEFEANVADLKKAKSPKVTFEAEIAGKTIKFKDVQLDVSSAGGLAKSVLLSVKGAIL